MLLILALLSVSYILLPCFFAMNKCLNFFHFLRCKEIFFFLPHLRSWVRGYWNWTATRPWYPRPPYLCSITLYPRPSMHPTPPLPGAQVLFFFVVYPLYEIPLSTFYFKQVLAAHDSMDKDKETEMGQINSLPYNFASITLWRLPDSTQIIRVKVGIQQKHTHGFKPMLLGFACWAFARLAVLGTWTKTISSLSSTGSR